MSALVREVQTIESDELSLESHKQKIEEVWAEFQKIIDSKHDETTSTEAAQTLDELSTKYGRLMRSAISAIDRKISSLNDAPAEPKAETEGTTSTSEEKVENIEEKKNINIPEIKAPEADTNTVQALQALIQKIADQFNEMAHGHIPSGSNDNQPDEETLGGSHSVFDKIRQMEERTQHSINDMERRHGERRDEANAESSNEPTQQPLIELKLDKVQLTTFSGEYTEWITFRDQFTDLVHNNKKLTPITKFFQLRSHLKGLALDCINGFKLTAADYEAAWFVLKKRYDRPDKIIDEYLRKFLEMPRMNHPNPVSLLNMINTTNQMIRVLPVLGVDVKTWDVMIKYNLKAKLDQTTCLKWLDQVKLRQDVPLTEMLEFLEVEAGESVGHSRDIHVRQFNSKQRNKKGRSAATMTISAGDGEQKASKCVHCKGIAHPLYLCPTFMALPVSERIKRARAYQLCYRCLRKHDKQSDCRFSPCPVCQKEHNSILCYQKERNIKGSREARENENNEEPMNSTAAPIVHKVSSEWA